MQGKKSKEINIINATINVVLFVGNIPLFILLAVYRLFKAVFRLLPKCTRFVVVTIPNACKRAVLRVITWVGNTSNYISLKGIEYKKRVAKTFNKVVKMPNKYALQVKNITQKPRVKYVRKKYHAIALEAPRFVRNDKFKSLMSWVKTFSTGGIFTLLFIVTPAMAYSWYRGLPQPGVLVENAQTHRPTRILDRKGVPLYEIYVDKKYAPVALNQIPKNVILATLAVEDHEFFNHNGVRFLSIARAAKATIIDDSVQGGSTITQQLIKNVLLSPERTITRKLKEVFLALVVEKKYTKEEILELYLNNIPYGGTAWGIQSASQKFFGKDVSNLTLGEAAFLAGLPSSPSSYVSYASDIDLAKSRQKLVLDRMEELKIITPQQSVNALAQDLKIVKQAEYIKAPHFVQYVRKELEKKYGRVMVESGGLTVKTSLDLDLQNRLQEVAAEEVAKSGNLNISNGAMVVLEPKSGEILAYVGSIDYFKEGWGAYDVITAMRQPGSAIKVVTYALALEQGFTSASLIVDAPLTIQLGGGQTYRPVNYDGRYHGTVTLRSALANSYNIPAVKMVKEVGPDNMVTLGNKMGLRNWQVDDSYGYSVTLGGKETRLLDLTNVYATLARGGLYRPTTPFISVKDANGFELYSDDVPEQEQVLSPESAYIMSNILSDNYARTLAFGSGSSLYIPGHTVAVKTGTTNEKRDNYTVGYTPSFVVGVWVGNNDNSPMNPYLASGVSGAAPIWNRAMQIVLEGSKDEQFGVPEGVFVKIDNKCGKSEVFAKGSKIPNLCPEEDKEKKDEDKKKDQ
ncbi:MAG: transglycosylase domain-containing protein [Patescibacteria group bacterium]